MAEITITGLVAGVSQDGGGFKIGEAWFNRGRNTPPEPWPTRGQRVTVRYEERANGTPGGWVNNLEILDGGAVQQRPAGGGRQRMTDAERSEVRRMNVLRTAADFAGRLSMNKEGITSNDVLKIADVWLEWLEKK